MSHGEANIVLTHPYQRKLCNLSSTVLKETGVNNSAKLICSSFLEKAGSLSLTYSMTVGSDPSVMQQIVPEFLLYAREYASFFFFLRKSGTSFKVGPYCNPNTAYGGLHMMTLHRCW